ncbi:MAG: biosynthetic arginine decarboxylase [Gammaproteobacteria bacterium]|nr:biosynthetic arginine decarboxylase [Gammaproteobacteria bacterium]
MSKPSSTPATDWSVEDSRDLYNILHWSGGYFDINAAGHVEARPNRAQPSGVDLYELVQEIHKKALNLPVLVRFGDILQDRVNSLCSAFEAAMAEDGYEGGYSAVYPIKVNQQRGVVEQIITARDSGVGLEAGSKPELMAVLGLAPQGSVIVCNGYKDREYVRLALIGQTLGHKVYLVLEKLSELDLVLEESQKLGISPQLGVRVRLASVGAGKWQNSGGEKAKFGLTASQVLQVIECLREAQLLDSLQLIHFHLGSQLANISDIHHAMREAARYYAELYRLGVKITVVDVGGGLGIDYEGTRSRSACSMNYSLHEYAKNVVHTLWEVCRELDLPQPHIVSESGRAMTAHHAVLITNVVDVESQDSQDLLPPGDQAPLLLQDMWQGLQSLQLDSKRPISELYHDAINWLAELQAMYTHGLVDLPQRALAEQYYTAICFAVREQLKPASRSHRSILDELNEKLADKYFCNFSLFQSLPDVWAIDQIFPVMPLHRLQERPTRRVVLQDITCDSDGRIDEYVDGEGLESSLPLHPLVAGQAYVLGFFLVGAYQEILGDMHNLFGDTHSINVVFNGDGYELSEPRQGDGVDAVLRYVDIEISELEQRYRDKLKVSDLSQTSKQAYLKDLIAGLSGYTYLED